MSQAAPNRLAVVVPFAVITLIWGSTWLVIRGQLGVVPLTWSVAYRFAIGGATMLGYALWRREPLRLDARGLRFAAILGVMQFCLNFNFVYRAETFVTSGLVAVVYALLFLPNAVLARVFLGQRITLRLVIGSAIALLGIAALFVQEARGDPHGAHTSLIGIGVALLGVASASVANVMQATITARRYPMAVVLGVAMLIGAAVDAVLAGVTAGPPVFDPSPIYVGGLLYLGVFASAIAFTLYFGVIRVIGPARAAYSGVIVPVIAMLLSTLFEGYRWSWLAASGAVLALAGLLVALSALKPAR